VQEQKEKFLLFRIRRHQDQQAFKEIYKAHIKPVRRFLFSKLPTDQVDDAAMTTFSQLWDYLLKTRSVESLSGLVFTISRGVIASYYRSRPKEETLLDQQEMINLSATSGKSIEASVDLQLLKKYLVQLPEVHQELITLRYFEQLSIKEIAQRMQRTENSIRVMLHRVRKKMRTHYESHD